jgi:sorbitol-specific phosphotransferase system component IIBC
MYLILSILVSFAAALLAYAQSRSFVTRRLRYVDAVQTPLAPFVAGIVVAVVLLPIVALLPLVGVGTAVSVGFAVGAGVAAGARDVRHSLPRY